VLDGAFDCHCNARFCRFKIVDPLALIPSFDNYCFDQRFLAGETRLPREALRNLQGGASPYALYNMESLINKLTNKYIF